MSIQSEQIDRLLPQTQCGLCGYKGCRPYAEALAEGMAPINLCPPGGVETLDELAKLLHQDPSPYYADMEQKHKPIQLAVIREDECIGCTKCIQACPLDAIVGAAKQMHSILDINCSGCELCIAPCPVDCIDLVPLANLSEEQKEQRRDYFYQLNEEHQERARHAEQKK
ncbi:MAG TPA: RnfABCDGE type electron transport complex subunit B, partial [Coxiellaceae bacterium]|nr:RnfABCDGE type electron transport complex subunit B [Coxiellaceae bacterium]